MTAHHDTPLILPKKQIGLRRGVCENQTMSRLSSDRGRFDWSYHVCSWLWM